LTGIFLHIEEFHFLSRPLIDLTGGIGKGSGVLTKDEHFVRHVGKTLLSVVSHCCICGGLLPIVTGVVKGFRTCHTLEGVINTSA
jgi:hypothetical protein